MIAGDITDRFIEYQKSPRKGQWLNIAAPRAMATGLSINRGNVQSSSYFCLVSLPGRRFVRTTSSRLTAACIILSIRLVV
ncbi:predicted protein [Botrytis cinerea T4]|uniref:Uncharacterized protein n=1 Tax=Botryotinia fuckeliana (strain T4) TaxID=999810 RepID=G2Y7Q8_BOTF4|nr:predicted protein [Botrytis cinerea T4]